MNSVPNLVTFIFDINYPFTLMYNSIYYFMMFFCGTYTEQSEICHEYYLSNFAQVNIWF